ncbi:recombinase family protein [Streptomyces sp. NPDC051018]|uniref:recombinase family protein n=1 Tax=Streptomyces sp. NPDC051018 TaxID=3365639 RepID=UPI0037ADDAB3
MKRLGRGAAELLAIAEDLRRHDIQLELLTGPLHGVYDLSGHGAALFAFFAGMAESEREYIREKSLEGRASARERGRHGGRPKVVDDDMAAFARSLRVNGVPVPEITGKLVITSGKNQGKRPSLWATPLRGTGRIRNGERCPGGPGGPVPSARLVAPVPSRAPGRPGVAVPPGSPAPSPRRPGAPPSRPAPVAAPRGVTG